MLDGKLLIAPTCYHVLPSIPGHYNRKGRKQPFVGQKPFIKDSNLNLEFSLPFNSNQVHTPKVMPWPVPAGER